MTTTPKYIFTFSLSRKLNSDHSNVEQSLVWLYELFICYRLHNHLTISDVSCKDMMLLVEKEGVENQMKINYFIEFCIKCRVMRLYQPC